MKSLFITMEGSDGCGKTTQIELLKKKFEDLGCETIISREPGGTAISEKIRNIILDNSNINMSYITEAMLYAAARAQLVEEVIRPALESGKIVICDRFVDSSLVYQGIARGLGIERIAQINSYALKDLKPDITFFLDLPPVKAMQRKRKQAEFDRIENEKMEFHNMVYEGYKKIAEIYKERIISVDASQSIEKIHLDIYESIKNKYKQK